AQEALFTQPHPDRLLSFDLNWRPALWRGREEEGRRIVSDFAGRADIVFCTRTDAEVVFGTSDPHRLRSLFTRPRYLLVTDPNGAV
ncbi:sugar kinase, partial [Mycobacterium tuberculosis]|nr:sugar kinase [Mycobacterium tuberculosis]